jgi:hypothetical protein
LVWQGRLTQAVEARFEGQRQNHHRF